MSHNGHLVSFMKEVMSLSKSCTDLSLLGFHLHHARAHDCTRWGCAHPIAQERIHARVSPLLNAQNASAGTWEALLPLGLPCFVQLFVSSASFFPHDQGRMGRGEGRGGYKRPSPPSLKGVRLLGDSKKVPV